MVHKTHLLPAGVVRVVLWSLAVFFSAAGCGTLVSVKYTDSPAFNCSYDEVWDAARGAVSKEFPIVSEDKAGGTMESKWVSYQQIAFDEYARKKAYAKIVKAENGGWTVKIAVQVQRQLTVDGGTSNPNAFWTNDEPDHDEAAIILTNIKIKLLR